MRGQGLWGWMEESWNICVVPGTNCLFARAGEEHYAGWDVKVQGGGGEGERINVVASD